MIICIQNLVLIGLFVFKILSKISILALIKGRNSVANLPKFELIQLSCMFSLPARMKKIKLKMKVLDCSQDFSHYKSMGIFPDAHWKLTPQSTVRSGQISNSSKTLWLSSLPAKMKKIQSKKEALECSQHYTVIFQTFKGPKPNAAFPHPNDGSDKISLRLAHWLQRYSSLKMFTDRHTR